MSMTYIYKTAKALSTPGNTILTSDPFDSTGYTHAICFGKHEGAAGATQTFSDNKGSSGQVYYTEKRHSTAALSAQFCMFPITSPGSGHTVSLNLTSSREYIGLIVWLINVTGGGSITLDVESTAEGTASNIADAGSLVTTAPTISFMGVGEFDAYTFSPGTGWTEDYNSGHYGQSRSDASGTLDPYCTISGAMDWVACALSFKEVAGGGGGLSWVGYIG